MNEQPNIVKFEIDLDRQSDPDGFRENLSAIKNLPFFQEKPSLNEINESIYKFIIFENSNRLFYKSIQSKSHAIEQVKKLSGDIDPILNLLNQKISESSNIQSSLESIKRLTERFKTRLINGITGFEKTLNYVQDTNISNIQEKFREYLSNRIRDDILSTIIPSIYVGIKDSQLSKPYIDYLKQLNSFLSTVGIFTLSEEEIKNNRTFNYDFYTPRLVTDNSLDTDNPAFEDKIKKIYSLPYFFGESNYIVFAGEATGWRYFKKINNFICKEF